LCERLELQGATCSTRKPHPADDRLHHPRSPQADHCEGDRDARGRSLGSAFGREETSQIWPATHITLAAPQHHTQPAAVAKTEHSPLRRRPPATLLLSERRGSERHAEASTSRCRFRDTGSHVVGPSTVAHDGDRDAARGRTPSSLAQRLARAPAHALSGVASERRRSCGWRRHCQGGQVAVALALRLAQCCSAGCRRVAFCRARTAIQVPTLRRRRAGLRSDCRLPGGAGPSARGDLLRSRSSTAW
jgi:hypothetical protein